MRHAGPLILSYLLLSIYTGNTQFLSGGKLVKTGTKGPNPQGGTRDLSLSDSRGILQDPQTGRFLPGNRGGGRPQGSVSAATKARELLGLHAEELVSLALEQVREGKNTALLSDLLRFAMPQQRSQLQNIVVPGAAAALERGEFEAALGAVTQAVLNGELSPDAAKTVTDSIRSAEEAKRIKLLQDRVEELSRRVFEGSARRIR